MKITSLSYLLATTLLAGFLIASPAHAQIIGVNFSGGGTPVPSSTLAGFVPQLNWNNLGTTSGSLSPLVDNTGAATAVSAAWGANGSVVLYGFGSNFTGPNATGNTDLYSSSLLTFGGGGSGYQGHITLTGITYATYDVYAYFSGIPSGGSDGYVNLNGTPNGTTFTGGTTFHYSGASVTDFVAANGSGTPANYALFSGVSGSSLTLYEQGIGTGGGGLVGIQVVNTAVAAPEPSTFLLLGVGLVGMMPLWKRRSSSARYLEFRRPAPFRKGVAAIGI